MTPPAPVRTGVGSLDSFMETALYDSQLLTPVRLAWARYEAHCAKWGFEACTPSVFVRSVEALDGVKLLTGNGRGRMRRAFQGIVWMADKET